VLEHKAVRLEVAVGPSEQLENPGVRKTCPHLGAMLNAVRIVEILLDLGRGPFREFDPSV
jgi:hypothetical protein